MSQVSSSPLSASAELLVCLLTDCKVNDFVHMIEIVSAHVSRHAQVRTANTSTNFE